MADVTTILETYLKLRQAGRSPQAVLGQLRAAIEPLTETERTTLARGVRLIERGMTQPDAPWSGPATTDDSTIDPPTGVPPTSVFDEVLAALQPDAPVGEAPAPSSAPTHGWVLPTTDTPPADATPDERWSLPRTPRAAPLFTAPLEDDSPLSGVTPRPAPASAAPSKPPMTDGLPTWSFDEASQPPAAPFSVPPLPPSARDEPPTEPPRNITWVACPVCQEANVVTTLTCSACGALLVTAARADTRVFSNPARDADVAFPLGTTLVLRPRNAPDGVAVDVTPTADTSELMVGRHSARGAAVTPDVDLASLEAEQLGVSRLHMALHFDVAHERLSATDLASANGTFVNGQRLAPREARVLRHGDELRLGRLVLVVLFRAGPPATARV